MLPWKTYQKIIEIAYRLELVKSKSAYLKNFADK